MGKMELRLSSSRGRIQEEKNKTEGAHETDDGVPLT
jgi:hypothetical protein